MSKIGVIGGIVADIEGNPYGQIQNGDSNPATIHMSYSGTGRNIADNLARIGEEVMFVSAVGNDFTGRGAISELHRIGVDTRCIKPFDEENTAVNMAILNIVGDLEMAFSNGDAHKRIAGNLIEEALSPLKKCEMVAIDTLASKEAIEDMVAKLSEVPLFLDPVSVEDAEKVKEIVGDFHTIKPNRAEAEVLTGMSILSEDELTAAGQWFINQGVKRVYISLSGGGVYYTDGEKKGFLRPKQPMKIVNPQGGGDAFSAAILSGFIQGFDIKTTAEYAMALASLAIEGKKAVNENITKELLKKRYEDIFIPTKM